MPFNWGTTALLVRADLFEGEITSWNDLWSPQFSGKIALRDEPREPFGLTLKILGFSVNSENPDELGQALEYLLEIKDKVVFVGGYAEGAVSLLAKGEVVALVGWANDALFAREKNVTLSYVYPSEGAMLWGDNFVIPANSPRQYTAEIFLNFLLRPEIAAQIVNENYYATPNEAASAYIDPELLEDSVIFPASSDLQNAEVLLPLSPTGSALYNKMWEQFKSALEE